MFTTLHHGIRPAVLFFYLALGLVLPVHAQMTGGPGLSSGSGEGTGAGGRTGVLRNQSGSMSGVGPGSSSGLGGRSFPPIPGSRPGRGFSAFGPGADVTFPNDPYLIPFMALEQPGIQVDPNAPTSVTADVLANARMIATADERSFALQRIANGAIASNQLTLAHQTLEEATAAASEVTVPLVRDQRLIALVTSLTALTEAFLREGKEGLIAPLPAEAGAARPEALPKRADGNVLIRSAQLEWKRAVYLAEIIGNPTYRNEMLYKVAESEASGSASIANEYVRPMESDLPAGDQPGRAAGGTDADTPPKGDARSPKAAADNETFKKVADSILVDSFEVAKKIDRLIWKYRAMVRIALLAADSQQYSRGVELARGIRNGESRAEAMLLLAEAQSRQLQNEGATAAYEEAARAVATVQQDGLRGVLAGFVVESQIATGRYEDARRCTVLYPEQSQQLVALGAIAETQGRRGSAESARRWIASEVRPEFRPTLYRHVTTGVLWAIEQNRSKDFMRPDTAPAIP